MIVVERYDRQRDGTMRIHQEDMCQALGYHPTAKYQSDGGPAPSDIVKRIRQVSTSATEDVERFILALGFNWLIVGTDAHAKNYSLLIADNVIRLAPLYDIASALPYSDVHVRKRKLAMKIGSSYRPHQIDTSHFAQLASDCGVNHTWLVDAMRGLAENIDEKLAQVADESGLEECRAMISPISEWVKQCKRALG